MYRGNSSRFIPIVLVLVIVAIAIVALVSVGRLVFGGHSTPTPTTTDTSEQALLDTSGDHYVRMTARGPIVADEDFHTYQVTITPTSRELTTYQGYLNAVISSETLDNTTAAYAQFVNALDKANYMKGTALTGNADSTNGICATGRVYEFDVMNGSGVEKDLWTSTCKGSKGSLNASLSQVGDLFLAQFPDGTARIDKVGLDVDL